MAHLTLQEQLVLAMFMIALAVGTAVRLSHHPTPPVNAGSAAETAR